MRRNRILLVSGLAVLFCARNSWAQRSGGVTSDGTAKANEVSKFTTNCNIEPSAITESGGNVGIGKAPSVYKLDVGGPAIVRGTGLGVLPKFNGVTFPMTAIFGCSDFLGTFATVTFGGKSSCTSFALGSNGTTTIVNAPSGVNVVITNGGTTSVASFGANAANIHVPLFVGLPADAAPFNIDSSGNVIAASVTSHGNVNVGGNLSVGGTKNFQIDDPLDPRTSICTTLRLSLRK
jgi:hypothetical protein